MVQEGNGELRALQHPGLGGRAEKAHKLAVDRSQSFKLAIRDHQPELGEWEAGKESVPEICHARRKSDLSSKTDGGWAACAGMRITEHASSMTDGSQALALGGVIRMPDAASALIFWTTRSKRGAGGAQ